MSEKQRGKRYFSHDADAHNDPKMQQLIAVYGYEGYGWFWRIVEQLTVEKDHCISLKGKYAYQGIAKMLNGRSSVSSTDVEAFVQDCINEFHLFGTDGEKFWSETHLNRMQKVDEKLRQCKEAAAKSVEVRRLKLSSKKKKSNERLNERSTDASTNVQTNINRNINRNIKLLSNDSNLVERPEIFSHPFFENEKFKTTWNEYMTIRDEKKIPVWSETQTKAQWNKLLKYSEGKIELALFHLEEARDGAWKGFHDLRDKMKKNTSFESRGKINDRYDATANELRTSN